METENRNSTLEAFANAAPREAQEMVPVSSAMPAEWQSGGAIAVAVKRDEVAILQKLKVLAAAAGSSWYYRFPVKNNRTGETDFIEGPSIKLANELARVFGNCEVDCRAQDLGQYWLFHARFRDLETGYSLTRPFQQRKNASKMGGDADRKLDIAFQIGASKAIRNVVTNALETFADFAFEEAKGAIIERIGRNLEKYRTQTAERVAAYVEIERVEAVMGRKVKEWIAPDVARVIALMTAINDGMATLDETFPPLGGGGEVRQSASDALGEFAKEDAGNGDTAPETGAAGHPLESTSGGQPAADAGQETPDDADVFAKLTRRLGGAPDEAACHHVWETMELDSVFAEDEAGRRKATKILNDRLKAIRNAP